jgi:hypothetical protein
MPSAVTPDSSTGSPSGESVNGYFHVSNGASNGANGHAANGDAVHGNGANASFTNGVANGLNGLNGHGHSSASSNGSASTTSNGDVNGTGLNGNYSPTHKVMPIAIVGMACRMPGSVSTPAEFWELCTRARTGFTAIPPSTRFNSAAFHHPNPGKAGCFNPVGGNFLNVDLAAFDAPFFGLTEKEAISMDPQQRLLLECTFEALESAGMPKHEIVGRDVGVFVGGSFPEYESHLFRDSDTIPMHQATGEFISVASLFSFSFVVISLSFPFIFPYFILPFHPSLHRDFPFFSFFLLLLFLSFFFCYCLSFPFPLPVFFIACMLGKLTVFRMCIRHAVEPHLPLL